MDDELELTDKEFELLLRLEREGSNFNHKEHYGQFYYMRPFVDWALGGAWITDAGYEYIQRRQMKEWNI